MNIPTDMLKGIETLSLDALHRPLNWFDQEKAQMRDQIEMLEREVERQEIIIDALVKAIKIIERG